MWQRDKLGAYARLMRLDKPVGIYLLLWPTLWALWLAAGGLPPWHILVVFVLGTVVMRSAGCVINDYADRHVDGAVKRTKARPIVSGEVSEKEALGLFAVLVAVAFLLVLQLNLNTILLSFGALFLASLYPFTKRFTYLPQFFLGAAFSWGIPMAFMAIHDSLPWWAWLLYLANLLWTVAYDTQYAMVDRDDDLKIGIKSTAILFGRFDRAIIGMLQVAAISLLAFLGWYLQLDWMYFVALIIAGCLCLYQQWLIAGRDRERCFKAFLNNHHLGWVVALGIAAALL
ncbi:4-hydroxybenzoate octaprenyltransferase [Aliiglaciecola sp. CAU 1673]|uniref:4-hydroxybenzoate octaprenyltransferase n=1 Tax=Aliiglaciecola sp. CAU 1673 TaxID=3032595 RepID=UPI0023D9C174|nr:4-hydroxybenzoate octaprenyltransferase [Aliiglaciecola sp. CAU 1673]MDF2179262.1 4-hydroxybenzoate octaprenyltransferase [Aliiglaciecola sp. CAU 1673]